ncbi:MAG: hypothetical protein JXQ29_07175, partial [Planctomycetes bacterium]|nr:hypothetical protein [Planctomycetota bacterium]
STSRRPVSSCRISLYLGMPAIAALPTLFEAKVPLDRYEPPAGGPSRATRRTDPGRQPTRSPEPLKRTTQRNNVVNKRHLDTRFGRGARRRRRLRDLSRTLEITGSTSRYGGHRAPENVVDFSRAATIVPLLQISMITTKPYP